MLDMREDWSSQLGMPRTQGRALAIEDIDKSTSDALRAAGLVGAVSNGSSRNGFFNVEDHRYKTSKKPMPSKLTIGSFIKTQNRFDVLSDARPPNITGLKAGNPGGQATRPKPLGKSSAFKEGQKHTSVEDGLSNLEIYATIA